MGKCLLALVNNLFLTPELPPGMMEKWLVSIPKKGDLTDRDNYRGIVLMDTILKLITRMLNTRIMSACEEAQRFITEQGGFRPQRECVSQVIGLIEVVQRIRAAKPGKGGYLLFVDLTKAYDRVPHEALFLKMNAMGIRGKCLEFFRRMYKNTSLKIRTSFGLSEAFEQLLGVHQGGPFSPTAFDIYINDLLGSLGYEGTRVPGTLKKFLGLLFADDTVLWLPTRKILKRVLVKLEEWGQEWGMSFGVKADGSKSAILPIGEKEQKRAPKLRLTLCGKEIPVVTSYKYLGVLLDNKLSMETIRSHALQRGRKALQACRHILANQSIPVMSRVMVFQSMVVNSAMYGAEVFGGTKKSALGFTRLMQIGLNLCFQGTEGGGPSMGYALEAEILPFYVKFLTARIRLYAKSMREMDTWLSILVRNPIRRRKDVGWVQQTKRLVQRHKVGDILNFESEKFAKSLFLAELHNSESHSTKFVLRLHEKHDDRPWRPLKEWLGVWERFGGGARYEKYYYQVRTSSLWTTEKLAKCKLLPEPYKFHCPMCEEDVPETIDHYVFVCSAWAKQREVFLRRCRTVFGSEYDAWGDDRLIRVLGDHPCSLTAVGLSDNSTDELASATISKAAWVRARAPIWEFLVATKGPRGRRLGEIRRGLEGTACVADTSIARGEAITVGLVYDATTDMAVGSALQPD
jgi:hypothetical protein